MIKPLFIVAFLLLPALSYGSILTENWLSREYQEFRTYPRMDRAYKKIKDGENTEAILLLQKVVEIAPSNYKANSTLLELCLHVADFQCVLTTGKKWYAVSYNKALPSYYLALAYYNLGQTDQAIDSSIAALESSELGEERYNLLCTMLLDTFIAEGRLDEVLTWVGKARFKQNIFTQSKVIAWADQLIERGFYYSADQLLLQLPQTFQVVEKRATLFELWGKYEQAATLLVREPDDFKLNNTRYWLHLAQLYQKSGSYEEEFLALRTGIEQCDNNKVLYQALLTRLVGLAQLDQAADIASQALDQYDDPALRSQLVNILSTSKRFDEAIKQVKILLTEDVPDKHTLREKLAYFLDRSNKWDELGSLMVEDYQETGNYESLLKSLDAYRMGAADQKRRQTLENAFPFSNAPISHRDDLTMELLQLYRNDQLTEKVLEKVRYLAEQQILNQSLADRLLNIAQKAGRCDLAIPLAERQMKLATATSRTYKIAGYCLQEQSKPGLAMHFLQAAEQKANSDTERREILPTLGYLAAELNRPGDAIDYWLNYLGHNDNTSITLDALRLALSSGQSTHVELLLAKLDGARLSPDQMSVYLFSLGYHAMQQKNYPRAKVFYDIAYRLSPNALLLQQLAEIEKQMQLPELAINALDQALAEQPDNSILLAERGYLKESIGDNEGALADFKASQALVPDRMTLTPQIAHTELRLGHRKEALAWFYRAIDESIFFPVNPDDFDKEEDRRFALRRTTQTLEDRWTFNLAALSRLDNYDTAASGAIPPVAYAGYGGFYSGEAAYRFDDLPGGFQNGKFQLYGRALSGMKNQSLEAASDTAIGGIGLRYRIATEHNIFLTGERIIGLGSDTKNDWMFRMSGNYSGGEDFHPMQPNWMFWESYGDLAYTTENDYLYLYANANVGWQFKVNLGASPGSTLAPYLTAGYSSNNGNEEKTTVDRVDIGLGLGLFSWHFESKYRASSLHSRLRLEGRTKIAGNTEDDKTARLIWEIFF